MKAPRHAEKFYECSFFYAFVSRGEESFLTVKQFLEFYFECACGGKQD